MGMLFDPRRIIPRPDVRTVYCHGPRQVDLLDGGNTVSLLLCEDQPVGLHGLAPMSMPVVRLLVPVRCHVWNCSANAQWVFDHGLAMTPAAGPTELRPKRDRMV